MTKRVSIIGSSSAASVIPGWNDYEWQQIERAFLTEGVIEGVGSAFAVTERGAGANMTVDVASGRALIEITNPNLNHGKTYKVWFDNDATVNVSVPTADGTNPRIDRVVLRVDVSTDPDGNSENVAIIELLEGTPAGSPSAPATPSNAISLATISVPASDMAISNAQITDDRSYVQLGSGVLQDVARQSAVDDDIEDLQNDEPTWLGTITGTDTLTGSATPTKTAYVAGQRFAFKVANNNTGAVTLNVDSLGAKNMYGPDGVALSSGDIIAGGIVECRYDGTQFVMTSAKHSSTTFSKQLLLFAKEIQPATSGGCGAPTFGGDDTVEYIYAAFDSASAEKGFWTLALPSDYTGGTITAQVIWLSEGGSAGQTVEWEISLGANADGENTGNLGTHVATTDTYTGDGGYNHTSPATSAITIGGTPAAGELLHVQIRRDTAADNLSSDARFLCLILNYT